MKLLLNYANHVFAASQWLNSVSGRLQGGLDDVASFGPADIDPAFAARNRHTLSLRRGNGCWLWKPYFIRRELMRLSAGDFLFYCDSGVYFLRSIDPLVEIYRQARQDLVPFELPFLEREWTKRDAFVLLDCERPQFTETPQRLASFVLLRKSSFAEDFVSQWLALAEDPRLLTDQPNECGLSDYPGFREHRFDQSLFSLLTKRHGLAAFPNPACRRKSLLRWTLATSPRHILCHTRWKRVPLAVRLQWQARLAMHSWRTGRSASRKAA
jgi:hypothetical protein